jgi:phytoene dehydrogenase-like protein
VEKVDILIVGSGMGSLTAGALLAQKGMKVTVLEQNWQPGGCTSSYWRKGFVFEAGATTLVGLGDHMPLQHVLDKTGIEVKTRRLQLPMQVHLADGRVVNRYENPDQWIAEVERVFGPKGQRAFWEEAFQISDFVWKTSLKQKLFPPSRPADLLNAVRNVSIDQVKNLPGAFKNTRSLLQKHGLTENKLFCDFVNEQLLITAQNHMEEVSTLFGATALCYTNYPNFYVDGGLLNLVTPFVDYIKAKGGAVRLREGVEEISRKEGFYEVITKKQVYQAQYVISGIPVNDTLEIFNSGRKNGLAAKLMESKELNSAFQMGIGFRPHRTFETIHHQIHLEQPLAETGSASIFISLNHPEDKSRTDEPGQSVMSVSTHLPDPAHKIIDGDKAAEAVVEELVSRDFLKKENIIYQHSSTQKSWAKWTGRKWGFVGGYPQYMAIKPWQMLDARLDKHKAYMVGDTVYPGQGIPGVTLSGIIAVEKLCNDWAL